MLEGWLIYGNPWFWWRIILSLISWKCPIFLDILYESGFSLNRRNRENWDRKWHSLGGGEWRVATLLCLTGAIDHSVPPAPLTTSRHLHSDRSYNTVILRINIALRPSFRCGAGISYRKGGGPSTREHGMQFYCDGWFSKSLRASAFEPQLCTSRIIFRITTFHP